MAQKPNKWQPFCTNHSKTEPFTIQTHLNHPKSDRVRFSSRDCISNLLLEAFSSPIFEQRSTFIFQISFHLHQFLISEEFLESGVSQGHMELHGRPVGRCIRSTSFLTECAFGGAVELKQQNHEQFCNTVGIRILD